MLRIQPSSMHVVLLLHALKLPLRSRVQLIDWPAGLGEQKCGSLPNGRRHLTIAAADEREC
jgi:hypothetical protein